MEQNRRKFITDSAAKALWAAPALTVLMTAGRVPAKANGGYSSYGGSSSAKVTICHKGNTISVDASAVPAHILQHGDTVGPCAN